MIFGAYVFSWLLTFSVYSFDVLPALLVYVTVKVYCPAFVGVPLSLSPALYQYIPGGSEPVYDHEVADVPVAEITAS